MGRHITALVFNDGNIFHITVQTIESIVFTQANQFVLKKSNIIKRKITKFFDIEENKSKGHEETAEEHEMNKTNYVLRENVTLKEVLVEVNSNNEPKIEQEFEPDY